jgi:protoporphyrinogen oxidase
MAETIILGAGISGISASYHLGLKGIKSIILEKDDDWAGLCGNFKIDGFRFDKAIHLSFTENEYVKKIFSNSTDYIVHKPNSSNFYSGFWTKHPLQNNLYPLPTAVKVKVIADFVKNQALDRNVVNYEDWLKAQYGDYFAEEFPMRYTRKYWRCEARELTTSWVGNRMYKPNIEEVLQGALSEDTPNTYYAKEMRYPKKGGYKSFLNKMAKQCNISTEFDVVEIDTKQKLIKFANGEFQTYEYLISTIPLPEYANLIKNLPSRVKSACDDLQYTSVGLVSVGLRNQNEKYPLKNNLWFYIYDEDILAARCYSPSAKSPDNAPKGCYSYQFEIYFNEKQEINNDIEQIKNKTLEAAQKMGLFDLDDVLISDYRILKYGNVIFNKSMEKNRGLVLNYLNSESIHTAGRFGEWDYLWSDQSLLSGKRAAQIVVNNMSEV